MRNIHFVPNRKAARSHARFTVSLLPFFLIAAFLLHAGTPAANATTLSLNFGSAVPGTILDGSGNGTGLPTRLSGTGATYGAGSDSTLTLNTGAHTLTIAPTNAADFNGATNLANMEALGVQLSSLGYTGSQDFSVSASFTFPAAANADYNQFGVYVANSGTVVTRDGFVFVDSVNGQNAYSTNDNPGAGPNDTGTTFSAQTFHAGDSITASMTRIGGTFTETVTDTTPGHTFTVNVTPANPPGAFLNSFSNLNVGIYATETNGNLFSLPVTSFSATVVPEPSSMILSGLGLFGLAIAARRRRKA
jgi:hypothetical protein